MFGHMFEAASGTLVNIKKGLMKLLFGDQLVFVLFCFPELVGVGGQNYVHERHVGEKRSMTSIKTTTWRTSVYVGPFSESQKELDICHKN